MSRRRNRSAKAAKTPSAQFYSAVDKMRQFTSDSFQNSLARTGYGTPSLLQATTYPLTRLTKEYNLMNSLYRNSWIVKRIIDVIPKDMLKNWIKYTSDIDPEKIDLLHKMERKTRLRRSLGEGLRWGRLYGGAVGLMIIEGQEDQLEEPVDIDSIMPDDFKGLLIADIVEVASSGGRYCGGR